MMRMGNIEYVVSDMIALFLFKSGGVVDLGRFSRDMKWQLYEHA